MAESLVDLGFPVATKKKGFVFNVASIPRLCHDLINPFLGGSVQSIESLCAVGEEDFVAVGIGQVLFEISHHGIGNGVVFHFKDTWPMR